MIVKDYTKYESDKYKLLERVKVKIKDMWHQTDKIENGNKEGE